MYPEVPREAEGAGSETSLDGVVYTKHKEGWKCNQRARLREGTMVYGVMFGGISGGCVRNVSSNCCSVLSNIQFNLEGCWGLGARNWWSYICNINVLAILDPFWEESPPSQCNGADATSLLSCYGRYEYQNFTVKKVNYTSHTMTVGPTNTVNDVCSPDFFQSYENLNKTLLQYYVSLHHVTVFFDGCPPHIPNFPSKRKWRCGDDVYYFEEAYKEDHLVKEYPLLNQCKRTLLLPSAAPLDHYDDSDDGAGVLEQSLRDGFGLYYGEPPYCTRCSQSDGSCRSDGYDEDVVSCHYYCSDKDCYAPKSNGCADFLFAHLLLQAKWKKGRSSLF
ncbi:hypothetical protein ACSQ67_009342 [Phaseolus vulgaris]